MLVVQRIKGMPKTTGLPTGRGCWYFTITSDHFFVAPEDFVFVASRGNFELFVDSPEGLNIQCVVKVGNKEPPKG